MKFISTGDMDFQYVEASRKNNKFGNFVIPISEMQAFRFETNDGVSIQSEDFYLQKLHYSKFTKTYSFNDYLRLNNTYKNTGYFETYEFASSIDAGCYRIRAGSYYSVTLITAKDMSTSLEGFIHGDINGDFFGDTNGDYFGEN